MSQKKTIRVLLVDDSADDRELILLTLRRGGYEPDYLCVDTEQAFTDALENRQWDIILCDYSMPAFDGISALAILNKKNRDIPFILVSGAIGEELAVKAMKAGAHDYLMKDNLQRLVPAIEREINEAENRKKHREAERERDRLLMVIQNSLNEIYIFDEETLQFRYLNQAAISNLGYFVEELSSLTPYDINPQLANRRDFERIIKPLLDGVREKELMITRHVRKDGSSYPIEVHLQLIEQNNERFFTAIGFDLTNREKDAKRIKEQKEIAKELALHSKYKSEFLANMSHELRTPLNSIILLSKLLLKSKDQNLTTEQSNYVDVIHQSGNNLLELINEVLDLSKIEAGEMEISLDSVPTAEMVNSIRGMFASIADEKKVQFHVKIDEDVPPQITSDQMRVEQVLKNLLSNAFKFTEEGEVSLRLFLTDENNRPPGEAILGFEVRDTGIGIPKEKQSLIFESFRQVDGSTQRMYGGTGLGLAICKQIAELLGGKITVTSTEGEGSTFILFIPVDSSHAIEPSQADLRETDRQTISGEMRKKEEKSVLQSQPGFSGPVSKITGSESEVKILIASGSKQLVDELSNQVASDGVNLFQATDGKRLLEKAVRQKPSAVLLDPFLPGMSGWSIAKQLSETPETTSVPVWFIDSGDKKIPKFGRQFAKGVISLPFKKLQIDDLTSVQPPRDDTGEKTILLVDDNRMHNMALKEFAAEVTDRCLTAESSKEAFELLNEQPVDCIVLDLTLPDDTGAGVLEKLSSDKKLSDIPVIIYSGKSLTQTEKSALMKNASAIILKSVGSHAKLLDKISWLIGTAKSSKKKPVKNREADLSGKTVLVVEDDEKSFFSLSSLLRLHKIEIIRAVTGREALQRLHANPDIDIVLMDIMMPDMDGLDALKEIRNEQKWQRLPVISVTAKAMQGDREACLELGATDYVSKPIDPDKLLTLITLWIH